MNISIGDGFNDKLSKALDEFSDKLCEISINCGDNSIRGEIILTKKQRDFIEYATNPKNWDNVTVQKQGSECWIGMETKENCYD